MEAGALSLLSVELFLAIGSLLTLEDLKQLRLTCQSLGEIFSGSVVRSIRIFEDPDCIVEHAATLRSLADRKSAICFATQKVIIGYSRLNKVLPDEDRQGTRSAMPPAELNTVMDNIICGFLNCKSIETVRWRLNQQEPEFYKNSVMNALKVMPHLRELKVEGPGFDDSFDFNRFECLESITLTINGTKFLENFPKFIASSSLTSLHLVNSRGDYTPWSREYSLHSLLKDRSKEKPMRLCGLSLEGFFVLFDWRVLTHLKFLTSLSIINRRYPSNDLKKEFHEVCSSSDELWKALQAAGIYLRELEHDWISDSLISYLSSFVGLQKLKLDIQPFENDKMADTAAVDFFTLAFPKHSLSIKHLTLCPVYEGQWCVGPERLQDLSRCQNLKFLCLSINTGQLTHKIDDTPELPDTDILKQFIDLAHRLPSLKYAALRSATQKHERGSWCGTGALSFSRYINRLMVQIILKYRAPLGPIPLPDLSLTSWRIARMGADPPHFIGTTDNGYLKYMKLSPS